MLEAWISAMVCLNGLPSTSSSTVRYLIFPSRLTSCPFNSVLEKVARLSTDVDSMRFGAGFILALVVLPALAGGDAEDGVVLLVLRGFDFGVLSETADEDDFVEHGL